VEEREATALLVARLVLEALAAASMGRVVRASSLFVEIASFVRLPSADGSSAAPDYRELLAALEALQTSCHHLPSQALLWDCIPEALERAVRHGRYDQAAAEVLATAGSRPAHDDELTAP
jgi:hypothetical protein